jgi:YVTN family beta-propeller protein
MNRITISAFIITIGVAINACRKQKIPDMSMEKNINYPAAYVVNGEDGTLSVIKLADNTVTETIELMGNNNSMAMWPHHIYKHEAIDMIHLVIAAPGMDLSEGHAGAMPGMKGRVLILDAVTGMMVKEFEVPARNHNAVYSPDGKEIWTSQMVMDGKVLVYDAATYTLKATIDVGMEPAEVTFSADGSKAYVANGGDGNVTVINPASKAIITTIAVGDNPVAAWIGKDGKMYVDNEDGKSVSVISVAGNNMVQTIDLGFMPGSVAHNALKSELWVTDPENAKVHYYNWDAGTNGWVHGGAFEAGDGAHAIAFTNDGDLAYVTNQGAASVSVIHVASHAKLKDIPVGKKPNGILINY